MNRAGLESRLMDIYRNIDREKVQFDFYTNRTEEGEFDSEIRDFGGKVYYSDPINPLRIDLKIKEFKAFLLEKRCYSIIHSHVNEWSTLFCKGGMLAGVPVRIAHSRGANKTLSMATIFKDIIKMPIKKYATDYFAVSKEAGTHLFGKKALDSGRVIILPNGIDATRYAFNENERDVYRAELNIGDNIAIIHVGNLIAVKNHLFLLKIFMELKQREENIKLFLVGEGEERARIEAFIKEHELGEDVILLGKRKDVPQLLQAADVFIFPSFHEGFPGAVLEAEASGLPCLISDTITKEVKITKNVIRLSIKEDPSKWAKTVVNLETENRTDCVNDIINAGYDIKNLASRMENMYLKMESSS